jgi:hypothetical protein
MAQHSTPTEYENDEYDSGYRDGYAGLSYISGESAKYQSGFYAGRVAARADGKVSGLYDLPNFGCAWHGEAER